MKITQQELEAISEKIKPHDTDERRRRYLDGEFPNAAAAQDLNKRYRWDLFYHSRAWRVLENEYTDAHIYTALRNIVPDLEESK